VHVLTLELDAGRFAAAQGHFQRAGLRGAITQRQGDARLTMPAPDEGARRTENAALHVLGFRGHDVETSAGRVHVWETANPAGPCSASQFGTTPASIGIGGVGEETLSHDFAEQIAGIPWRVQLGARAGLGTIFAMAVVTYGHVVFGELAPRGATINNPERVSRWLVPARSR